MLDDALPVGGTTDAASPTFYSTVQLAAATERIVGYNVNGNYRVPSTDRSATPAQQVILRAIYMLLLDATPTRKSALHLSEIRSVEDFLTAAAKRRDGAEREATLQMLAILQATYANGGDNDEAGSITNTEHLLLDLEQLHRRWADSQTP